MGAMGKDAEEEKPSWDLDTALRHIGPTGRWQLMVFLLNGFMYATLAFHFLSFVFLVDTPDHHCKIPVNATKNETIPRVLVDGKWVDDKCNMYVNYSYTNATMPCTDGWEYDKNSGYISTVVTDFDLTCGKNILVEVSMMISSGTMALFQVFANKLADTVGRKTVFLWGCLLRMLFGVAKAFSPNMITYIVLDACIYAAQTGFASMLILMNMELFPAEHRSTAATTIEFFWLLSCMLTVLVVYLFRNWQVLQLVMHAPLVLGIAYYWLIPESLPWLISKGKYKQAQKLLELGARINKRPLPPGFFDKADEKKLLHSNLISSSAVSLSERKKSISSIGSRSGMFGSGPIWVQRVPEKVLIKDEKQPEKEEENTAATIMDVLRSPRMLMISLILFLLWFTNSIVYSALNLTVTYLSGDRYLNFLYLSLAEVPAVIAFHIALNIFGRRIPLCVFHIICGVALLSTMVELGYDIPSFVIGMNFVGKFGITASYCSILVFTPELYPTSVRSVFFGICFFCALVANLIAPYCRPLERSIPGIVRGICGSLSLLVGVLVLLLPETFRRPLPATISHVENWTRTVSKEEKDRYYELREQSKKKNINL